jgi:hypothetical protein
MGGNVACTARDAVADSFAAGALSGIEDGIVVVSVAAVTGADAVVAGAENVKLLSLPALAFTSPPLSSSHSPTMPAPTLQAEAGGSPPLFGLNSAMHVSRAR